MSDGLCLKEPSQVLFDPLDLGTVGLVIHPADFLNDKPFNLAGHNNSVVLTNCASRISNASGFVQLHSGLGFLSGGGAP